MVVLGKFDLQYTCYLEAKDRLNDFIQVFVKNTDDIYKETISMNKRKKQPGISNLPTQQVPPKLEMELPPHGLETCLACRIMKNLRIKRFNNIPSNCRAKQQTDFWCSLLYLDKMLKY
jgi:hypothetical protein